MSLSKLIEAVERGEWDAKAAHAVFGIGKSATALKAFDGSLDAAKRLHDALLPGRSFSLSCGQGYGCNAVIAVGENRHIGNCDCPARAWLLAILRALEQEGR